MLRRPPIVLACFLALSAGLEEAHAQQTIINVPSDAKTPKGRYFYLHESFIAQNGDYQTTNFLTYGLTRNTELAATLYNIDNTGSQYAALGLGFKSTFELLQEIDAIDLKWTFGNMTPFALQNNNKFAGFFTYTHLTFNLFDTDWRALIGVAGGSSNLWGRNDASALVGLEYPITKHLSFTGEWFSGTHNLSGLIPGFTYHRGDLILVAGYKISNDFDADKFGPVLEAGIFFGGGKKISLEDHEEYDDEDRPNRFERHYGTRAPRRGLGSTFLGLR